MPETSSPQPPKMVFLSRTQSESLARLANSIRQHNGVHGVIGAPGAGKEAFRRLLLKDFAKGSDFIVHTINGAQCSQPVKLLAAIGGLLGEFDPSPAQPVRLVQQNFTDHMLRHYQEDKKSILLLVTEAERLPASCFSALAAYYNAGSAARLQLQVVFFGSAGLEERLRATTGLLDSASLLLQLKPFKLTDSRILIQAFLKKSATDTGAVCTFSLPAQWLIHHMTEGNPQAVVDLSHFVVLSLLMRKKNRADWFLVQHCAKLLYPDRALRLQLIQGTAVAASIGLMLAYGLWPGTNPDLPAQPPQATTTVAAPGQPAPDTPPQEMAAAPSSPPEANQSPVEIPATPPPLVVAAAPPEPAAPEPAEPAEPAEPVTVAEPVLSMPGPAPTATQGPTGIIFRKKLEQGDTFEKAFIALYGPEAYTPENVKLVLGHNPHIQDPKLLTPGEFILFPALPGSEPRPQTATAAAPVSVPPAPVTTPVVAVATVTAPAPAPAPPPVKTGTTLPIGAMPAFLGMVTVQSGDTLGDIIRRTYGPYSFTPSRTRAVLAHNADVSPAMLHPGMKIKMPTFPVRLAPGAEAQWWVQLGSTRDLENAYRFLRIYDGRIPPLLIIPTRGEEGLRFRIILQFSHTDRSTAETTLEELREYTTEGAEILHGLDRRFFYYEIEEAER